MKTITTCYYWTEVEDPVLIIILKLSQILKKHQKCEMHTTLWQVNPKRINHSSIQKCRITFQHFVNTLTNYL